VKVEMIKQVGARETKQLGVEMIALEDSDECTHFFSFAPTEPRYQFILE
jgi:hypothetical protein